MVGERIPSELKPNYFPRIGDLYDQQTWDLMLNPDLIKGISPQERKEDPPKYPLKEKFQSLTNWLKSWLPPEPTEIQVDADLMVELDHTFSLNYSCQELKKLHGKARRLLEESTLDQILEIVATPSGPKLRERRRFANRIERIDLEDQEQTVFRISPKE